ncbi:MAG: DUF4198 domain-containing protein [Gemmatimonadaceae bacterium]
MRNRKSLAVLPVLLLLATTSLAAHDLFLKLDSYFVPPNSRVRVLVLNGTFSKSENSVEKERIGDISLVSPSGVAKLDTSAWSDRGDTSILSLRVGEAGTYIVGASVRPRELRLEAKEFNQYLTDDGLPDIVELRRKNGELEKPARERYSKHVKAILQAGTRRTEGYATALGYPAEIVPLEHPYSLRAGGWLRVRALVDGSPVMNQLVLSGGRTASGARIRASSVRTDTSGVARIRIPVRGKWYVKFIHMQPARGDTAIDYESKWATLTFQVR